MNCVATVRDEFQRVDREFNAACYKQDFMLSNDIGPNFQSLSPNSNDFMESEATGGSNEFCDSLMKLLNNSSKENFPNQQF